MAEGSDSVNSLVYEHWQGMWVTYITQGWGAETATDASNKLSESMHRLSSLPHTLLGDKVPFPFPVLNCFSLYQKSSSMREGMEDALRRLSSFLPLSLLLSGFVFIAVTPQWRGTVAPQHSVTKAVVLCMSLHLPLGAGDSRHIIWVASDGMGTSPIPVPQQTC